MYALINRIGTRFCSRQTRHATVDDLIAYLKDLEGMFPGLEYTNLSPPAGTPQAKMEELFQRVGEEVMPHFGGGTRQAAAQ